MIDWLVIWNRIDKFLLLRNPTQNNIWIFINYIIECITTQKLIAFHRDWLKIVSFTCPMQSGIVGQYLYLTKCVSTISTTRVIIWSLPEVDPTSLHQVVAQYFEWWTTRYFTVEGIYPRYKFRWSVDCMDGVNKFGSASKGWWHPNRRYVWLQSDGGLKIHAIRMRFVIMYSVWLGINFPF